MLIAMKCRIPVVSVGRPGMNLGTHEGRNMLRWQESEQARSDPPRIVRNKRGSADDRRGRLKAGGLATGPRKE